MPPDILIPVFRMADVGFRQYLYGAVLDKPKNSGAAGAAGKGQKKDMLQPSSRSKIVRVETSPAIMDDLLQRFKWIKHDIMQMLLRQEYVRSQQAQREKMLANLDTSSQQHQEMVSHAFTSYCQSTT